MWQEDFLEAERRMCRLVGDYNPIYQMRTHSIAKGLMCHYKLHQDLDQLL